MKTLLFKVSALILWLSIVQRASASIEESKELQLAIDFKKSHCANSYEASPEADETTVRCCAQINVNHCFEKEYGMKFNILLEPIIDKSCKEYLKDTMGMCGIDTSIYGYTISRYSLCRIKHQSMLLNYLSWNEENSNLAYHENFHFVKNSQLGNHTFCCFKKALYACFDEEVRAGCEQARSQMNESLRGDDSTCNCRQFSNDYTICPDFSDCNLIQKTVIIDEKRDYVQFCGTLLLCVLINSFLINYFCNKK